MIEYLILLAGLLRAAVRSELAVESRIAAQAADCPDAALRP
jgi:hypothetical protein